MVPLVLVWSSGGAILALVWAQNAVPASDLLLDPSYVGGREWYIGLVSSLGILAWAVSASACLGAGWVAGLGGRPAARTTFRGGGWLFTLLLLDDLFSFHSNLFPEVIGIPKQLVLLAYLVLAAAWGASSRKELLRTRWELLTMAAMAFGASIVIEVFIPGSDLSFRGAMEDSAKFFGVLALAVWSATAATDVVRSVVASAGPNTE